jgi:hypothetical protein
MIELCYFLIILVVLVIGFGVFFQALMYHNQKFEKDLVENLFFSAFLVIAGENDIVQKMMDSMNYIFNVIFKQIILFLR